MAKTDGMQVWMALMKAHQALHKRAEKSIVDAGMCFTDFRILEILAHKGPLPVTTIGTRTNLTSGSATTAIHRLQKRGLVERGKDPEDQRARIVHLTPEGAELIDKVFARHARAMERAAGGLSPKERGELADLLKSLSAGAKGD